jgi:hypothetical protein
MSFGGSKPSAPPPPPVAPTIDNSQVAIDEATAAQRQRSLAGRASTILTGGMGAAETANLGSAKLLGQ